jgi:hypothetical protein
MSLTINQDFRKKGVYNVKQSKNILLTIFMIGLVATISISQTTSPTKLAQTGFNFLSNSSDARSSGMGDAVNSVFGFTGALAHNPASMAEMPKFLNASFSMNKWIADINYLSASVIISPSSGDYGNIGFSVQSVDYGDVEQTIVDGNNPNGYLDLGILNPAALSVGVGYSIMLSKQFGIGAQIKYAHQSLGESLLMDDAGNLSTKAYKANALAYDFGTIYRVGIKSLAFGMSVTNFSTEVKYEREGFQLPLLFTIGISANIFDFVNVASGIDQELLMTIDWTHPRSHPEQIKLGAEYKFMKILSLRAGYIGGNDENDLTYGFGISSFGAEFAYSYTPFGVFNNVQRLTACISM